jgi:hypothetical protein
MRNAARSLIEPRAANTCCPASVIHTVVTWTVPSSSSRRRFRAIARPLRTSSTQDVGWDVLGSEERFGAAVGIGGDDFERTAARTRDTLVTRALHSRQLFANAFMAASRESA